MLALEICLEKCCMWYYKFSTVWGQTSHITFDSSNLKKYLAHIKAINFRITCLHQEYRFLQLETPLLLKFNKYS